MESGARHVIEWDLGRIILRFHACQVHMHRWIDERSLERRAREDDALGACVRLLLPGGRG